MKRPSFAALALLEFLVQNGAATPHGCSWRQKRYIAQLKKSGHIRVAVDAGFMNSYIVDKEVRTR